MNQKHMDFKLFKRLAESIPKNSTVWLQGEGEPTLHPQWEEIVLYVKSLGLNPFTIINGSRVDEQFIRDNFKHIGVSIDTVDGKEASKIGRYGLSYVLSNYEKIRDIATVYTVDYGQDLSALKKYIGASRHLIQKQQTKDDYLPLH